MMPCQLHQGQWYCCLVFDHYAFWTLLTPENSISEINLVLHINVAIHCSLHFWYFIFVVFFLFSSSTKISPGEDIDRRIIPALISIILAGVLWVILVVICAVIIQRRRQNTERSNLQSSKFCITILCIPIHYSNGNENYLTRALRHSQQYSGHI